MVSNHDGKKEINAMNVNPMKRNAFIFLLLLGFISLLSDFTHEGARSIYGPF